MSQDFKAIGFHFHSKSEHTIDGQQFDFEMHTVHLLDTKEKGYFAAALGIIFDESLFDKSVTAAEVEIIDNFFDSLQMQRLSSA